MAMDDMLRVALHAVGTLDAGSATRFETAGEVVEVGPHDELMALDGTREHLAQWVPPDVPLGFRMVSQADVARPATVLTSRRWWGQPLPAWAQAAAALVIFGVGLSLGALRGATMAPGQVAAVTQPVARVATSPAGGVSPSDLAALEQRLRAEIAQAQIVRAPGATPPAVLERMKKVLGE